MSDELVKIIGTDIKTINLIVPLAEIIRAFKGYKTKIEFRADSLYGGDFEFFLQDHGTVSGKVFHRDSEEVTVSIKNIWISGSSGDCLLRSIWDLVDKSTNHKRLDMSVFYSDNHIERMKLNDMHKSLEGIDKTVFEYLSEIALGAKLNKQKAEEVLSISKNLETDVIKEYGILERVNKFNRCLSEYARLEKEQMVLERNMVDYLQGKDR